ncbi:uncharacterized protein MYCGRDRAFT_91660 [Zymoseptoria tritici IPO323]|uniref:Uncharacterized protein n=1 Tax=Zymoseptoria tritici (strain CBS 115943 / IPO323) TaxID=336722 RepID=F9X7T0_ZYMTI|nr:uncharacterized protein MYCGRDRAFT_91660 [Zymoseptoria tritici IPO323]EGP89430.1 hypothetical protein MYCGRDRAFT_91660 [Zymoseptoria tritici IPO323]
MIVDEKLDERLDEGLEEELEVLVIVVLVVVLGMSVEKRLLDDEELDEEELDEEELDEEELDEEELDEDSVDRELKDVEPDNVAELRVALDDGDGDDDELDEELKNVEEDIVVDAVPEDGVCTSTMPDLVPLPKIVVVLGSVKVSAPVYNTVVVARGTKLVDSSDVAAGVGSKICSGVVEIVCSIDVVVVVSVICVVAAEGLIVEIEIEELGDVVSTMDADVVPGMFGPASLLEDCGSIAAVDIVDSTSGGDGISATDDSVAGSLAGAEVAVPSAIGAEDTGAVISVETLAG